MTEQPVSIENETPQWQHDTDCCTFLGRFNEHDLYFCRQGIIDWPTVLARYSDEGSHYRSGMEFADPDKFPSIPELVEAKKRAVARGLIRAPL